MNKIENFIQSNSPDGGFLQSEYWRRFQENYGRKTFQLKAENENGDVFIYANMITHTLPIVGEYFYVPRGPVMKFFNFQFFPPSRDPAKAVAIFKQLNNFLNELVDLARENNIGWIRVEPNSESALRLIKENLPKEIRIEKSSVDVQPREILVIDITKSEGELLAEMKQKTRYNIRLAEKRGVRVTCNTQHITQENIGEFLRLVKITVKRDKITPHPDGYYREMFESIPPEILRLYVAEYEGKVISANIVSFFGKTASYMHGASDNTHRNVMAPHLLQWQAILDAKKSGCTQYDFGGVDTRCDIRDTKYKKWEGLTKFKTGFALNAKTIHFPGCYDIVLKPVKYWLYKILRKIKP